MKWMMMALLLALAGCGETSDREPTEPDPRDNGTVDPVDNDPDVANPNDGGNSVGNSDTDPLYQGVSDEQRLLAQQSYQQAKAIDGVNAESFVRIALNQINLDQHRFDDILKRIVVNGIRWELPDDAIHLRPIFGKSAASLVSGQESQALTLGVISDTNGGRNAVLGSSPLRGWQESEQINAAMGKWLRNTVAWLTQSDTNEAAALRIVMAHVSNTSVRPDEQGTRGWFNSLYPGSVINEQGACDGEALSGCLSTDVDLLIISQVGVADDISAVLNALAQAQQQKIGVLYIHSDGAPNDLGIAILRALQVEYLGLSGAGADFIQQNMAAYIGQLPEPIGHVQAMLNTLLTGPWDFDFAQCKQGDCSEVTGFYPRFWRGAEALRIMLTDLDRENISLADVGDFSWLPWVIYAGDVSRQSVVYPLDIKKSEVKDLLNAMFADVSVYYSRSHNPKAPDLGSFSKADLSDAIVFTKDVELSVSPPFRALGVYVLPGETASITLQQGSGEDIAVFINSVRDSATQWWADGNQYNRPKFLRSPQIKLSLGKTVNITSPYGGPLQIATQGLEQEVKLRVERIGQHPFWRGDDDTSSFNRDLARDQYDWVEISTDHFEIHSKLGLIRHSLADTDVTQLAANAAHYTDLLPHYLAGYGVTDLDSDLVFFAQRYGLEFAEVQQVQHMVADQASCRQGCAGNPYDAIWSFSPVGHGDLHLIGQGLTSERFRFKGWAEFSATNLYSYYSKYRYFLDTGVSPECQALPFASLFEYVTQGKDSPRTWSYGAAVYLQLMMAMQAQGALGDGWLLMPRLHLLERRFNEVLSSSASWSEHREQLGFANISYSLAQQLTSNDWLLVAMSMASGRDVRPFMEMFGIRGSNLIQPAVNALTLPELEPMFYAADSQDYCEGLVHPALAVDGSDVWPVAEPETPL